MSGLTLTEARAAVRKGEAIAEYCVQAMFSRRDLEPEDVADMIRFRMADAGTGATLPFIRRGVARALDKQEAIF